MEIATPPTACPNERVVVLVEGQKIPNTEAETFHSRDGIADRNTYSNITFPTSWKNEDIIGGITAFQDGGGSFDLAEVYWQDAMTGTWTLPHVGYVRSVGGGSPVGTARMVIGDYAQWFSAIPISVTYDDPTVATVINDVTSKFTEKTGVSLSSTGVGSQQIETTGTAERAFKFTGEGTVGDLIGDAIANSAIGDILSNISVLSLPKNPIQDELIKSTKNFTRNRHTIRDVMEWVCGETNAKWYIDIQGGEPVLVYDQNLQAKHFVDAGMGSPGARVIDNDAVQEIVPINTLTANGESSVSLMGYRVREIPSDHYPTATVQYDPLVDAAGGELLHPVVETDTLSIEHTEEWAKHALRKRIQGAASGDITMYGKPDIEPGDHFTGRPTCDGQHVSGVPPIEYEVISVQHKKVGGKEFGTRIGVNIWVDPAQISTVTATMEEV